jgi:hypothetical protein
MPPNNLPITNQLPSYTNQPIFAYPMRAKLELPKFDKNEKQGIAWFNKAEEYFEIYSIDNDDEKINYASMQLEGGAYNWYMGGRRHPFLLAGIYSKMISLKDSKVSKRKTFLQNSLHYNKREMWTNLHVTGKYWLHKFSGYQ